MLLQQVTPTSTNFGFETLYHLRESSPVTFIRDSQSQKSVNEVTTRNTYL